MDRLRAMSVFIAAAGSGSLSAAARQLGQPLATVSRQLAALEAHVGAVLLARTTRSMALTDAGRAYLETCRRILEDLDAAETQIGDRAHGLAGEISVTAPVAFGRLHLVPVVTKFLDDHPRVSVRLVLSDRVVDLAEEGIDAALRIGEMPDSSLIATRVGSVRRVVCAAPAYLRKHGAPDAPKALSAFDCIAFGGLSGGARWAFKSAAHGRIAVRISPRLTVNTAEAAIDAAIGGAGVTRVLSYQAETAMARRKLVAILDDYEDGEIPVQLVQRTLRLAKPHVRAFAAFAAEELRKRFAA